MKNWGSIFEKFSLDPVVSYWGDKLFDLTPVHKIGDMFFKREDMFAPLGYGGINGSKLRQAIWLVREQMRKDSTADTLISGASVKSPQLPMSTAVANHFGYDAVHVIGATRPDTCMSKDMVKMATWLGAGFNFIKVGYNPVLQNKVDSIIKENPGKYFKLNYGITIDKNESRSKITEFHAIGAHQVKNIPDIIENIIIPAGSCNSCISVLYGLQFYNLINLKNVYLIGIGPNKLKFIQERLELISKEIKVNTLDFSLGFETDELKPEIVENKFKVHYIDINSIPKYDYQNEVKFNYHDIEFHPTYEGKIMDYIIKNNPELVNEKTLMWIVGSKPRIENMQGCEELGDIPIIVKIESNDWEKA